MKYTRTNNAPKTKLKYFALSPRSPVKERTFKIVAASNPNTMGILSHIARSSFNPFLNVRMFVVALK